MWLLLDRGLAEVELARLAEVVGERLGPDAPLVAATASTYDPEPTVGILAGPPSARLVAPGVRLVVDAVVGFAIAMCPSCWKWATGQRGAFTGMWVKFGEPSRLSCVSR